MANAKRDLNKEAWCWYHRTSKEFFEGAIDASQAVVDFFGREAVKRGLGDFGRNGQVYDAWRSRVLGLTEGLERTRFGDYQTIYAAAQGIESDVQGIAQWVFMGWLEEAEKEFERLMGIASNYAGRIIETLRPGLKGGEFWLERAATATPEQRAWSFGPIGERITFFLKDYGEGRTYKDRLPHFNQHPVPEVFPGYEPDMSRPCKAGERVPWTGVWYPEPGIERHSLTFAIEGLPMPPAWKILRTVEEQREDAKETGADPALILSALVEVTDMTWYPLREVPPVKEEERPFARRVEGGEVCPREGYWWSPADKGKTRIFKKGEIMPIVTSTEYGSCYWLWSGEIGEK